MTQNATLDALIQAVPQNGRVLDYGCFNWCVHRRTHELGRSDILHAGVDTKEPVSIPNGVDFYAVDVQSNRTAADADRFDLVVASHLLEHVADPVGVFAELVRLCKPGGHIYLECPSDRSVRVKSSCDPENHAFLSFWDDPTHIRPWTPAAFYRLGISFGIEPLKAAYIGGIMDKILFIPRYVWGGIRKDGDFMTAAVWRATKWACLAVFQKPHDVKGLPAYRYISLKSVPYGVKNALGLYDRLNGK